MAILLKSSGYIVLADRDAIDFAVSEDKPIHYYNIDDFVRMVAFPSGRTYPREGLSRGRSNARE